MSQKIAAGAMFPEITLPTANGADLRLGGAREGWQLIVVYRGLHCPLCKKYLTKLEGLKPEFDGIGTEVVALSGDPKEKAVTEVEELGLTMPVAYGLSMDQMRALGLYISEPRSPQETDRPFPEPAIFAVNPSGQAQIIDISNAPFSRPDLDNLLSGLTFVREKDYPIRGTLS